MRSFSVGWCADLPRLRAVAAFVAAWVVLLAPPAHSQFTEISPFPLNSENGVSRKENGLRGDSSKASSSERRFTTTGALKNNNRRLHGDSFLPSSSDIDIRRNRIEMNTDLVGYNNESADLVAVVPTSPLLGGGGDATAVGDRYIVGGGNFLWNVEKSIFRTLTVYFALEDLDGQNLPTNVTSPSTSNQSAAADGSTTPPTTTTSGSSSVTDVIIQNITIRVKNVTGNVIFARMPLTTAGQRGSSAGSSSAALLISDSLISVRDSKGEVLGFGFGGYDTIENSVIEVEGCTFGRLEISPAASADGSQEAPSSSSSVLFRETALMMTTNTFNGGNNAGSQRPPLPACFVVATFSDSSTVEFSNNTLASLKGSSSVDSGSVIVAALIKSSSQLHFANNVFAAGGMSLMVDFAQCVSTSSTGTSNPSSPCLLWVERCSFLGSASVATGMSVGTAGGIDTSGAVLVIDGNSASELESNSGSNHPTTANPSPSTTPMNLLFARLRGSGFVSLLNNYNVRPLLGFSDGYGGNVEIWGNAFSDLSPSGPALIEYYTEGTQQSTTTTTSTRATVTTGEGGGGSTVTSIPSVLFGYNVGSFALAFRDQGTVGLALAKTVVGCTEVTIPAPSAADSGSTTRIIVAPSFSATYECPNLKKSSSSQRDFSIAQQFTTNATTRTTPSSTTIPATAAEETAVPTILRCDGSVMGIEQFLPRYERVSRPSVEACFAAPVEGLVTVAPSSTTETATDPATSASTTTATASARPNTTTTFVFTTNATTIISSSAAPTDSRTNTTTTTEATTTATTRQTTAATTTHALTSAAPTTTPTLSPAVTGADRTDGKKSGGKDTTAAGIIIAAVGVVVVFLIISAIAIYFGYCRPRSKKDDPPYSEIGGSVGEGNAEPSYGVPPHLAVGQHSLNQRVDQRAHQRKMMGHGEINFGANNNSSPSTTARGGRTLEMHTI